MRRMTATQMGSVFGVSRQAVSAWKGVPKNKDGTFSLPDVVQWKLEKMSEAMELEGMQSDDDSPAMERYRAARAEKAELEVSEMKRELVSRADVTAKWGRVLSHIIQAFDGLGKVLAPRLARRNEAEIAAAIREEVHRAIDTARAAMLGDKEL